MPWRCAGVMARSTAWSVHLTVSALRRLTPTESLATNRMRPSAPSSTRASSSHASIALAVAEGFEPSDGGYPSHAFEACSLGRSDTPPPDSLPTAARLPQSLAGGERLPP